MQRADELLREALGRDRNHAKGVTELGRLRRLQGRLVESRIELERAIALDQNSVYAIVQSGITNLFLGRPEAALPYFEKWLRIDPQWQNGIFNYYWLGQTHLLLGHIEEAIELFRKGHSINPKGGGTTTLLAAALGLKGDVDEAKAILAEAFKLPPEATSFARMNVVWANWNASPQYVALREKTIDVGLRRAGMPEE
jgi:adenylate cyclase